MPGFFVWRELSPLVIPGRALLARARNPYAPWWLWIPGSPLRVAPEMTEDICPAAMPGFLVSNSTGYVVKSLRASFRGAPVGASPESIRPTVVMDSGLGAQRRPGMTEDISQSFVKVVPRKAA